MSKIRFSRLDIPLSSLRVCAFFCLSFDVYVMCVCVCVCVWESPVCFDGIRICKRRWVPSQRYIYMCVCVCVCARVCALPSVKLRFYHLDNIPITVNGWARHSATLSLNQWESHTRRILQWTASGVASAVWPAMQRGRYLLIHYLFTWKN